MAIVQYVVVVVVAGFENRIYRVLYYYPLHLVSVGSVLK
jgi:hypothetical protein